MPVWCMKADVISFCRSIFFIYSLFSSNHLKVLHCHPYQPVYSLCIASLIPSQLSQSVVNLLLIIPIRVATLPPQICLISPPKLLLPLPTLEFNSFGIHFVALNKHLLSYFPNTCPAHANLAWHEAPQRTLHIEHKFSFFFF